MSALLIGLWAVLAPVQAATKRSELEGIQKELTETRRQIEEFRRLDVELGLGLRNSEQKRSSSDRRLEELQGKRRRLERRRKEVEHQLGSLRAASGTRSEALSWELAELFRRRASREEAYGTRDLWSEALRRAVIARHADLLGSLRGLSRKAEQERERARHSTAELDGLNRQAQAERESTRVELQRSQEAYVRNKEKTAEAERRAAELEESARAMTKLLRDLEKGRSKGRAPASFGRARRSLPWPVSGRLLESFGRSRNEELGTWTIRSGIRLAAASGAAVSAVDDGKVIFAGPFRSYGRVVIVDHGAGFYSVYGELSEITVSLGGAVPAGGVVGKAGIGDNGGRLYLELRHGTEALDPIHWLKPK